MPEGFAYELTAHAAKVIAERRIRLSWLARALEQPERESTGPVGQSQTDAV
jgi:hypothetical protein